MKILISFLLMFAMLFSFAACSGGSVPVDDTTPSDTTLPEDTTAPVEDEKWPEIEGTVIYVDAAAEDGGDGTEEAPFKSIPEAQAKIREIKSGEGLPEGGITVLLAPGEYPATETINFTSEDSGTEDSPIRYLSAEKSGAVFTGGIKIPASDFSPLDDEEKARINDVAAKDKVLKIDLTKYGIPAGGSVDIIVDKERLFPARYPNVSAEDPYLRAVNDVDDITFDIFAFSEFEEQAAPIKERGLNWDVNGLYIAGYPGVDWYFERKSVTSFDPELLKVSLASAPVYGIKTLGRFYFYNIFAETDEFGEYYLDSNSMTLYIFPPENFEDSYAEIMISSSNFITADNVSYLSFDGIKFTSTKGNGLVLKGDHITVENCEISNIGSTAITAEGSDITIQNNEIYQVGANAISVRGGVVETLTPANILIYNNHIYKWAQVQRTYQLAAYIRGCGITVSHNEMYDAPHTAILYEGPKNVIEYNEIYNVCMETGDCGAIYAMRSFEYYGSIVRYNLIHDIGGPGTAALGIYWDDGISGQTAYGNIIANTSSGGMNIGGGRDNVIENNIFINWAFNDHGIQYDNRARNYADDIGGGQEEQTVNMANRLAELQKQQEWLDAFPGYGDIIPYTYDYAGDRDDPRLSCNAANAVILNNITCRTSSAPTYTSYISILFEIEDERMNTVFEGNYEVQDPDHILFPGYENGDYTLAEDAEPYKTGFVRIPIEEIGRITND